MRLTGTFNSLVIAGHILLSADASATAKPAASQMRLNASTREEVTQFLIANSTFKDVPSFPDLVFLEQEQLNALHLGGFSSSTDITVVSFYDRSSRSIYLPTRWSGRSPEELSMLIHEMVHFLQDREGRKFACPEQQEEEAFAVQERWLVAHGTNLETAFGIDPLTRLTASLCYF